jgi:predicted nuclease of predicted toxin-antitoxin system
VKFLFDQNLSFRLVTTLADLCPGSAHVRTLGMEKQEDDKVWAYARQTGVVLVSKDSDFLERGLLYGPPPKVIYLALGNCPTRRVEEVLRESREKIAIFLANTEEGVLILG